MIVVAIIAILGGAGFTTLMQRMPDYRLKRAVRELVSHMQNAKLGAIKENTSWVITFNNAANTYQVTSYGPDNALGTADDVNHYLVDLASYGSGVAFGFGNAAQNWSGGATAQQPSVTFSNRGLVAGALGSTYLTNQNNSICYAISTTMAGGLQLRTYNGVLPFNVTNWSK